MIGDDEQKGKLGKTGERRRKSPTNIVHRQFVRCCNSVQFRPRWLHREMMQQANQINKRYSDVHLLRYSPIGNCVRPDKRSVIAPVPPLFPDKMQFDYFLLINRIEHFSSKSLDRNAIEPSIQTTNFELPNAKTFSPAWASAIANDCYQTAFAIRPGKGSFGKQTFPITGIRSAFDLVDSRRSAVLN